MRGGAGGQNLGKAEKREGEGGSRSWEVGQQADI